MKNRVMIIGGDGYIGWPLSLCLSRKNYIVTIVDNFKRREYDSLPTTLGQRVKVWKEYSDKYIYYKRIDIAKNYKGIKGLLNRIKPDKIIYLAEQRPYPYSYIPNYDRRDIFYNNTIALNNLLLSLVELKLNPHIIYGGSLVLNINSIINNIYAISSFVCEEVIKYYRTIYNVKITELNLGYVWGINTQDTNMHPLLENVVNHSKKYDYNVIINKLIINDILQRNPVLIDQSALIQPYINIKDVIKLTEKLIFSTYSKTNIKLYGITEKASELTLIDRINGKAVKQTGYRHKSIENLIDNTLLITKDNLSDDYKTINRLIANGAIK
jgi:UDP-sulfoquinovose synthase